MGVCIDHGIHKKNHFFISDFSQKDLEKIKSMGFNFEILIEDVTKFYQERNKVKGNLKLNDFCNSENSEYVTPENYEVKDGDDFGGFYTYEEMLNELDQMYDLYPNIISERSDVKDPNNSSNPHIHQTYEGRFLQWVKISDNPNTTEFEPQILYTALHHAREPASMQQLIYFMWYLLENYESNEVVKKIIDESELFFIPCVNPDGYIYNQEIEPNGGGMWRKNRRDGHGVDNNRNYSFIDEEGNEVWNTSGTSNNPNNDTYAGDSPFSESENRAIRYFVESNNFKIALNNHTYGNLLLYPYGYDYNQPTEDDDIFEFISSEMVEQNNYNNIISSDLYPAAGDSDDFMYGMLNTQDNSLREKIFAMTPEIGSSFWPQASTIESICKEMVYHNLTAAKMIGNYAKINDISGNFISSNNFEFDFSLQRLGIIENENFTVSIVPLSNNILSISSEIDINFEQIGEIIYDSFNIQIDESTIPGDPVIFKLVVDNGQFNEETVIEKIYGEPFLVLEDDSDYFTEYWTEDSDWNLTYEEYFSPYTSITDSPNSNYSNNSLEVINLINSVDLNGISYAEINFDAKWSIESSYDYVQLEVSDDGGNSWVPQCGKFTNIGVETHDYAENEPLYDGYQTDWINESISLIDYLDKEILIRFKLYTDGGLRRDGFYFDNFKIRALSSNLSITDIDNSISKLYPNPVHNILNIQSEKLISKLVVFDMMGKIILTHSDTNIRSVKLPFLKPGIYLVKLHSENFTENHKIIKN
tara:strand:- start:26321 stop:28591 length:2271 start_codon:yes stop_codon:yes gene_type:complete